ncbi:hypothetical protein AB9F34_33665, partial [Rhizobium leguminosarum]
MVDSARLILHVPEPAVRPVGQPDFSNVKIAKAGSVPRPEVDVAKPGQQRLIGERPCPGTHRLTLAVQNADDG